MVASLKLQSPRPGKSLHAAFGACLASLLALFAHLDEDKASDLLLGGLAVHVSRRREDDAHDKLGELHGREHLRGVCDVS